MADLNVSTAAQYRERLEHYPAEWVELDAACRITISRFYRDRAVFDALRHRFLPELGRCALSEHRPMRCWSVGCCSGEEPFTLALALRLDVQRRVPGMTFEILSTDIDPVVLDRAQKACYPRGALVELPREWLLKAFRLEAGEWCLAPEYRKGIRWAKQDIRYTLPEDSFDLILCRNVVFTYLAAAMQQMVARSLHQRLHAPGLLVIGSHEHLPSDGAGFVRQDKLPIYRTV
jgi:chemotaxis protein methyltransferase CheR